ncbi:hypothetical protein [Ohtaekwangia sp.]|uniref:hypothetical protein n=1 Tax=Ohtaekwangia sp. TaxID=2066019 RepID=UPI002F92BFA9
MMDTSHLYGKIRLYSLHIAWQPWAPADRMFYVNRVKTRAEEGYANYNPYH